MNCVITVENFNTLLTMKRDELWLLHDQEQDYEKRMRIKAAIAVISDIRFTGLDYLEIAQLLNVKVSA